MIRHDSRIDVCQVRLRCSRSRRGGRLVSAILTAACTTIFAAIAAGRRRSPTCPHCPGRSPPVPFAHNATPIEVQRRGGGFRPIHLSVTGAVNAPPVPAGRRRAANRKMLCTSGKKKRAKRARFSPLPAAWAKAAGGWTGGEGQGVGSHDGSMVPATKPPPVLPDRAGSPEVGGECAAGGAIIVPLTLACRCTRPF